MQTDRIIIDNKTYIIHSDYLSYGVSKDGTIINILTRKPIEINHEDLTIRLKKYRGKYNTLSTKRFIWETYFGRKPNGTVIEHIDGDGTNFSIINLKLRVGKRRKLTDEQRMLNNKRCRIRWHTAEWICPKCGKITNNNASGYHKKVCTNKLIQ